MRPGAVRHSRTNSAKVAVDKHNTVFERVRFIQQPPHECNDGYFILFTINQPDSVASSHAWPIVSLDNQHELRAFPRHRATEDGGGSDDLQLTVNIEHNLIGAHRGHNDVALRIAKS